MTRPAQSTRQGARRGARSLATYSAYALTRHDRAALLRRCVRSVRVALEADGSELVCVAPDAAHRVAVCGLGPDALGQSEAPHVRYVIRHDVSTATDDFASERRFLVAARWHKAGMKSAVAVPVRPADPGERYVLTLYARRPAFFDDERIALAEGYALVLGASLAHRRETRAESAELLEHFAAVLAHEVRNPLNALAMNAEVATMLLGTERGADVPKVLERVGRDVKRCGAAIRELSAVVARDVPDEGIALDELLATIADRLRQGANGGGGIEVEIEGVDETLSYAGNLVAVEFALAQMARTIVARGVKGVRIGVEREAEGYAIELERLPSEQGSGGGALSPTRVAAYAVARHALEAAGARVRPGTLVGIPERCRISFPSPMIRAGTGA